VNALSSYYCVDETTFSALRGRYDAWRDMGHNNGDVWIVPVVELLNRLPGVATIFSCQGHPEEPGVRRTAQNFHLELGATEDGFVKVLELFARLRDRLPDDYLTVGGDRKKVIYSVRKCDLRMELALYPKPGSKSKLDLAPRVIIVAETMLISEDNRQQFIEQWTRLLYEMLRELNPKED
jgi:hypothetical protein